MSRTYSHINKEGRNKYKSRQENEYDFLPEFEENYRSQFNKIGHTNKNWPIRSDVSYTTFSADSPLHIKDQKRKHVNKRHRSSLTREFTITNTDTINNVRNPYGEVWDRSFRLKGLRKAGSKSRRTRLKQITRNIIENSEE